MPLRYKLCIGKLTSDYISPYLNAFLFTIRSLVAAFSIETITHTLCVSKTP